MGMGKNIGERGQGIENRGQGRSQWIADRRIAEWADP
jgi:hypothetical protein